MPRPRSWPQPSTQRVPALAQLGQALGRRTHRENTTILLAHQPEVDQLRDPIADLEVDRDLEPVFQPLLDLSIELRRVDTLGVAQQEEVGQQRLLALFFLG